MKRCLRRDEHGSETTAYAIDQLTITDHGGHHRVTPPSIACVLAARVEDDALRFAPQSCITDAREQTEIQGTARFDDEGVLELLLTNVEYWPPLDEFWPEGLWWDCSHDYHLDPIEAEE